MEINNILAKQNPTNNDLMSAIGKILELNNTKHEELKNCVNGINHSLESAVTEIKREIGNTTARVDYLENEMTKTNALVETLESEINFMRQKNIERNVLISGIPSNISDPAEVIGKFCDIFKFDLNTIESYFQKKITYKRSGRSGGGMMNQIAVTFKDKSSKEVLMSKVRSHGPIYVKQLYPQIGKSTLTISIREKLTTLNIQIWKKLLDLKKKKKISYCWFRHCNIYVKATSNDDEKPAIVRSLNDVFKYEQ